MIFNVLKIVHFQEGVLLHSCEKHLEPVTDLSLSRNMKYLGKLCRNFPIVLDQLCILFWAN
jgi:hypothetical protein